MPLLEHLGRTVEEISEVVPACLGLSVDRVDQANSCTITVSDEAVAVLEAMQYLEGDPGTDATSRWQSGEANPASLDGRWSLYAGACGRAGVRSILTLPVTENEVTIGAVRVYAGLERAFEGHADEVARLVDGGEAAELVIDSATTLTGRRLAHESPLSLRAQGALNRAIGALTLHLDTDVTTAYERLVDAAQRAGTGVGRLAMTVVDLHD
jgi:hypothetical protein